MRRKAGEGGVAWDQGIITALYVERGWGGVHIYLAGCSFYTSPTPHPEP